MVQILTRNSRDVVLISFFKDHSRIFVGINICLVRIQCNSYYITTGIYLKSRSVEIPKPIIEICLAVIWVIYCIDNQQR